MAKLNLHAFLAEMTAAQSPADKEFEALQPVVKKDHPVATEAQFKATTVKKDKSKEAHMSNATGMEDDIEKEKPLGEEQIDERFDHRQAGSHGVMHPDFAKDLKVGMDADFYDHKTGDKKSGKVTKNDGKSVSLHHEGSTKKFRVSVGYPGLNESFEDIAEQNLQEISKKVLGSYIKSATDHVYRAGHAAGHARNAEETGQGRSVGSASAQSHERAAAKRERGIAKATDKLTKEEVEEIAEISKSTLGSYIKKASNDVGMHMADYGSSSTRAVHGAKDSMFKKQDEDGAKKSLKHAIKRAAGIAKAADKLAK